MTDIKRFSLIKPTINTPFQIDFEWWKRSDNNWRVYLRDSLCAEHRKTYEDPSADIKIDWIDPETAEVQEIDGLEHVLIAHCAKQEGFLTEHTSIVDAVFRTLLANGNTPMTPVEFSANIKHPPELILRTFTGGKVYKGIRPRAVQK
jgi:hypothetical protein